MLYYTNCGNVLKRIVPAWQLYMHFADRKLPVTVILHSEKLLLDPVNSEADSSTNFMTTADHRTSDSITYC